MQVINTNVASLNAQRNLNNSQGALQTSLARLSSGLRINSAKDDAAGLAVSQRLGAQIKSLNQAMRNANDGISMLQTAEGAMDEMQNILTRMKELGTQAANGTIGSTERGFINTELVELRDEMQDIASRTNFNGQNLLTGSLSTSVNAGSTETNVGTTIVAGTSVTALDVSKAKAGTTFTFTNPSGANVTLSDGTNSQTVTVVAGTAGSTQTLDFSNLGIKLTLSSVSAETADNIAAGFAASGNDTIVTAAGSGATNLQIGSGTAVGTDTVAISFADMRINSSGAAAQITTLATALTNFNSSQSEGNARTIMSAVDGALDYFSTQRASLGALQNRMQSSVASTAVATENLSAARSRVRDADFAAETSALTRGQILQQAGQAMLAQANALPQGVLQLLRG
ncbi:MAG: flagellin [Burkholderiales bacterium]|jgi:flagellin|nr:flagellin [Burkholderiales bacterium]MCA3162564.1 flagellin [Burkholderiales bacterium]MCA3163341.1 flagellin [Burkholderiales bacterium]MCA3166649.1 flagellin [Burkholderiales bacterium]MCA3170157.1 flagellin [Burkholderiales bacterium]